MTHAIIINHHQLFLPGVRDLIKSIERDENFEVLYWKKSKITDGKKANWSSVSLLGNFQSLDSTQFQPQHKQDDDLIKFWSELRLPRIWICFMIDIHIGLNGMCFGKATNNKLDAKVLIPNFFDAIAWSNEHTYFNYISNNNPENVWNYRKNVAWETRNYLVKLFNSRLDFPWAVDVIQYKEKKLKKYDLCIPGAQYPARIRFEETLKGKLKLAPIQKSDKNLIQTLSYLAKLFPFIKSNHISLKARLREINMNRFLMLSKFAFTDGGTYLDYFVRKYLEIPVSGAVLICKPTESLKMYGFKKDFHFLSIEAFLANKNDLDTLHFKFRNNLEIAQQLLHKNHSFEQRINQLKSFLNLLTTHGESRGYFFDGDFILS